MTKVNTLLSSTHKTTDVYSSTPKTTVLNAAKYLRENKIGALMIIDDGKLVGVLSERDIVWRLVADNLDPSTSLIEDIMTKQPDTVTGLTDMIDCMSLMESRGFRHLPVVENNQVIGVVSMRDILIALVRHQELVSQNLIDFITGSPYRG